MPVVLLQTSAAVELEIELNALPTARFPNYGLVLVHPYSGLGGSMHDYVVSEVFNQAVASGAFGAVVRYNQRGVGRSSGGRFLALRNLKGQQDAEDLPLILNFVATQLQKDREMASSLPPLPPAIIIVGYSFGACIASHALGDPRLAAYVGISFPLGGLSSVLGTKASFARVAEAATVPRLLLLGSDDQYNKQAKMEEAVVAAGGVILRPQQQDSGGGNFIARGSSVLSAALDRGKGFGAGSPLLLKVFPGNGHFWESDCSLMAEFCLEAILTLIVQRS